jgi:hypothetical protein
MSGKIDHHARAAMLWTEAALRSAKLRREVFGFNGRLTSSTATKQAVWLPVDDEEGGDE